MNREERDRDYELLKSQTGMKEYIFTTPAMYRHFFVLGKDLKDAEQNFMRIDEIKRCGFTLEDLPIRLEYDIEKCKNWKKEDYWNKNENQNAVSV